VAEQNRIEAFYFYPIMMRDYSETGGAGMPRGFGSLKGTSGAGARSGGSTADYLD
jgi:hypothetical protein